MPNYKIGLDGVLNHVTSGSTKVELENVKDVKLSINVNKADTTTRANEGWSSKASTLKDATLSFKMLYDQTDTTYTTIYNALQTGESVELEVLTHTGGHGISATWSLSTYNLDQTLTEAQWIDVEADLDEFGSWVTPNGGNQSNP